MSEAETTAAFDRISPVYDTTRPPLEPSTLDAMAAQLRGRGAHRLLEVGVGTGRIAVPLAERGFEVAGLDAAVGMLAHARRKGLTGLVRGSAYRLPIRDRSVDTTLFVHVLHMLDDPRAALREACRVSRFGATALVRERTGGPSDAADGERERPRRRVAEILRNEGYAVRGAGTGGSFRQNEQRVVQAHPPDQLDVIFEGDVTQPLARSLDMIEKGAARGFLDVPPEALRRAVEAVRSEFGERTATYHSVEALAVWKNAPS